MMHPTLDFFWRVVDGKPGEAEPAYEFWARWVGPRGHHLSKRLVWDLDRVGALHAAQAWCSFFNAPWPLEPPLGKYWSGGELPG